MDREDLLYIENDALRVGITPRGAEMRVLYDKLHACEILKREDDPTWDGTAPILFPICGRLTEKTTRIDGSVYRMGTHGFASSSLFTVLEHTADRIVFTLTEDEKILGEQYPFRFRLSVGYWLCGASLETCVTVENTGTASLPFTVGFHPAFRLPLGDVGTREDAYLEFPEKRAPRAWRLTESGFLLRGTDTYPLKDGQILPLTREVFLENTSVFLEETGGSVRLRSLVSDRAVRLDYEGFPYLGLWRPAEDGAAFICIEPWMGCPDYDGEITELSEKRDMILLPEGASRALSYTVTVE